ncbi:MAG: hypothetical protein OEV89_07520 [Desulfobulbaceae bacterium]|nr:hypothetical protein [Desulfobulbaceae bacterium]HIJ90602.1 hypothetical protein [Deltaproteobacteria bacterium]
MPTRIEFDMKNSTLDMDAGTTLSQVVKSLEQNLQSTRPSKYTFLWSGNRQNKFQELDIRQQQLHLEQIRNIGLTANEMAITKANLFLIPTTVKLIIEQKENETSIVRQKFLVDMARLKDEILAINHCASIRAQELRAKEIENLRSEAEVALIQARGDEAKIRITLIKTVMECVDFHKLSETLQTYILTTLANPNAGPAYNEFEMQSLLKDIIVDENKAKKDLAEQNAKLKEQEVEDKKRDVQNKDINLDAKRKKFSG